jgi:hypothetical protein
LHRGYGTSGVINLVKTHLDKVGCTEAQAKKDKQPRKNGPLSAFFKEKTALIAKLLCEIPITNTTNRGTSHSPIYCCCRFGRTFFLDCHPNKKFSLPVLPCKSAS